LGTGVDNVTLTGFSLSGSLTIFYGNLSDVITYDPNIAATVTAVFSAPVTVTPPPPPTGSGSGSSLGLLGSGFDDGLLPAVGGGSFGSGSGSSLNQLPAVGGGSSGSSTSASSSGNPLPTGGTGRRSSSGNSGPPATIG